MLYSFSLSNHPFIRKAFLYLHPINHSYLLAAITHPRRGVSTHILTQFLHIFFHSVFFALTLSYTYTNDLILYLLRTITLLGCDAGRWHKALWHKCCCSFTGCYGTYAQLTWSFIFSVVVSFFCFLFFKIFYNTSFFQKADVLCANHANHERLAVTTTGTKASLHSMNNWTKLVIWNGT